MLVKVTDPAGDDVGTPLVVKFPNGGVVQLELALVVGIPEVVVVGLEEMLLSLVVEDVDDSLVV